MREPVEVKEVHEVRARLYLEGLSVPLTLGALERFCEELRSVGASGELPVLFMAEKAGQGMVRYLAATQGVPGGRRK